MLIIIFLFSLIQLLRSASINVKPLKLGIEVTGIKLQEHLNNSALFHQLKMDIRKHRLMVFRDQGELPADSMIKMFEGFGEIFQEPYTTRTQFASNHPRAPAPAIMRISNDASEGFKGLGTSGWHIDGAYKPIPFSHLIFNAVKASISGDTKFVGHREIMASMPKQMLEYMDHISAVNTRTVRGKNVAQIHPLIYNHPNTNESVMCIHAGYMKGAIYDDGKTEQLLTAKELEHLKNQITRAFNRNNEELVYSHKWRDGDLVIVDNLQVSHLASKESQMSKEKVGLRILHRLAVIGNEKPTKKTYLAERNDL